MIPPLITTLIRGSAQDAVAPAFAALPQIEFTNTLQQYVAGPGTTAGKTVAPPFSAILAQCCNTLEVLINQQLSEKDDMLALNDGELQHLQVLLAQFVLQQLPDVADSVLAKLGIVSGNERCRESGTASAHSGASADADDRDVQEQAFPEINGQEKKGFFPISAAASECAGEHGREERLPWLLIPTAARQNVRRTVHTLPRPEPVSSRDEFILPPARYEFPLHKVPQSGMYFGPPTVEAPSVQLQEGLAALTAAFFSQRAGGHLLATPIPMAELRQPLGSPAWQQHLGEQIALFNRNGIFHAELRLHPRELGAVKVNLRLNQEQLQVHFASDNQHVRAVLETSLTQLRTLLAENGIALGNTSVGTDAHAQQRDHGARPQHRQAPDASAFVAYRNGSILASNVALYHDGIDIYA